MNEFQQPKEKACRGGGLPAGSDVHLLSPLYNVDTMLCVLVVHGQWNGR